MRIIFFDAHIIVCQKDAGELSEGDGSSALPALLASAMKDAGEHSDVYPVHRLDRETVGVMVFARTRQAAAALSAVLNTDAFSKEYPKDAIFNALVMGPYLFCKADTVSREVLEQLRTTCPPLYGVLNGSAAVVNDTHVIILTANPAFRTLVRMGSNKTLLQTAVTDIAGRSYRIGVRAPQSDTAAATAPSDDPLEALLRNSEQHGIPVQRR